MVVGGARGENEDRRAVPLSVRPAAAGRRLAAIGLSRQAGDAIDSELLAQTRRALGAKNDSKRGVYIANVPACRPPGNHNPRSPDEIAQCEPICAAR